MGLNIINVCGFGNTGCTSQVDVLCDYLGVVGVLSPVSQDSMGRTSYHELGVLKCLHSFGGIIVAKINGLKDIPNKEHLKKSLMGAAPGSSHEMNFGANAHLEMRALLNEQYGSAYQDVVERSCSCISEDFNEVALTDLIAEFRTAFKIWIDGIMEIVENTPSLKVRNDREVKYLGLKNDPPGAYPLLATLIPGGVTSAILRNPQDTTFDFNRHYHLGHTDESVRKHCQHYNAQLNSARNQIEKYHESVKDCYFVHEFERLVLESDYRDRYVKRMIGDQEKVLSNFDPVVSSKNIGHHVNMTDIQIDYVTETCESNYLSFKELLCEKDMLLV